MIALYGSRASAAAGMRPSRAAMTQVVVRAGEPTNDRFYAGRVEARAGNMLCSGDTECTSDGWRELVRRVVEEE